MLSCCQDLVQAGEHGLRLLQGFFQGPQLLGLPVNMIVEHLHLGSQFSNAIVGRRSLQHTHETEVKAYPTQKWRPRKGPSCTLTNRIGVNSKDRVRRKEDELHHTTKIKVLYWCYILGDVAVFELTTGIVLCCCASPGTASSHAQKETPCLLP